MQSLKKQLYDRETIFCNLHRFKEDMNVEIVAQSPQCEIVILKIEMGFFKFSVSVYNEERESLFHRFNNQNGNPDANIFIPFKNK